MKKNIIVLSISIVLAVLVVAFLPQILDYSEIQNLKSKIDKALFIIFGLALGYCGEKKDRVRQALSFIALGLVGGLLEPFSMMTMLILIIVCQIIGIMACLLGDKRLSLSQRGKTS